MAANTVASSEITVDELRQFREAYDKYIENKFISKISDLSIYTIKGTVNSFNNLPNDASVGDCYIVLTSGGLDENGNTVYANSTCIRTETGWIAVGQISNIEVLDSPIFTGTPTFRNGYTAENVALNQNNATVSNRQTKVNYEQASITSNMSSVIADSSKVTIRNSMINLSDDSITSTRESIVSTYDSLNVTNGHVTLRNTDISIIDSTLSGSLNLTLTYPLKDNNLSTASATVKGAIKVGDGFFMNGDSLNAYTASTITKGIVKVGKGLTISGDGILSVSINDGEAFKVASPTADGLLSASDKIKLDSIVVDNLATKSDITSVFRVKSSVERYSSLPTTGNQIGDVYNIRTTLGGPNVDSHGTAIKAGDNVVWTSDGWDVLGGIIADATTSQSGLMSASDKTKLNGLLNITSAGDNIIVDSSGKISAISTTVTASTTTKGLIKVGSGLYMNGDTLNVQSGSGLYLDGNTLKAQLGSGLHFDQNSISSDVTLKVNDIKTWSTSDITFSYDSPLNGLVLTNGNSTLAVGIDGNNEDNLKFYLLNPNGTRAIANAHGFPPIASSTRLGIIKVGSGLSMDGESLNCTVQSGSNLSRPISSRVSLLGGIYAKSSSSDFDNATISSKQNSINLYMSTLNGGNNSFYFPSSTFYAGTSTLLFHSSKFDLTYASIDAKNVSISGNPIFTGTPTFNNGVNGLSLGGGGGDATMRFESVSAQVFDYDAKSLVSGVNRNVSIGNDSVGVIFTSKNTSNTNDGTSDGAITIYYKDSNNNQHPYFLPFITHQSDATEYSHSTITQQSAYSYSLGTTVADTLDVATFSNRNSTVKVYKPTANFPDTISHYYRPSFADITLTTGDGDTYRTSFRNSVQYASTLEHGIVKIGNGLETDKFGTVQLRYASDTHRGGFLIDPTAELTMKNDQYLTIASLSSSKIYITESVYNEVMANFTS